MHTHTHTHTRMHAHTHTHTHTHMHACTHTHERIHTHTHTHTLIHRAREALRQCLPEQLKDSTFVVTLKDDGTTKKWLSQLLQNLGIEPTPQPTL